VNDLAAATLLGVVQGLTEFLPVSSTGHLILVAELFKLDPDRFGLSFNVALHLGTAFAVLLYFARTWLSLAADLVRGRWRMPVLVAVGTIPAGVAGVLLESTVERIFRSPLYVVVGLVAGSIVFVVAERLARQRRTIGELGLFDAVWMGTAQAIALLPGISRSGITISSGLLRDLHRDEATRFSFLLATPVILGASVKTLFDARRAAELFGAPDVLAIGFAVSFVSGLAAVAFMVRFLRTHSLNWFVAYRLVLAAVIVIAIGTGALAAR
jgi:undecaprenyl-diphosphatase